MKFFSKLVGAFVALSLVTLAGCKDEEASFTGIKFSKSAYSGDADGTVSITATYYKDDKADSSSSITYTISADSTDGAYFGTSGTLTTAGTSGSAVTLTLGSTGGASVMVTASYGTASAKVTVSSTESVSYNDTPTGYAGVGFTSFYNASKVVTVSTKSDLVKYAAEGGYTILVDGMIDLSEGMLPTTGGGTTSALDAFVKANSSYATYSAYNTANTKSVSASADWTNPLNSAYGNKIRLTVASNTAIIGKTAGSGVKGGSIYINGKSNIIIRNLIIRDAYDPFPAHEKNDGWNAQHDNITIRNGNHIWVDHCTLEDTLTLATGANGEKWQTYDGLCDITNTSGSNYVTVSNCILRNHDKTMLIGSSDSDGSYSATTADESKVIRFVTLSGNYFENCGQRLPMVRNTLIHIYNNYYTTSGSPYASQSTVNARNGSIVYAENNYFGSGLKYAFNAASSNSTAPVLHASGNGGSSANSTSNISAKDSAVFSSRSGAEYTYTPLTASETAATVPSTAGAGVISVQ